MRSTLILALLIASQSGAAATLHFTGSVSVNTLRCEVLAGDSTLPLEKRLSTVLGGADRSGGGLQIVAPVDRDQIKLNHKTAWAETCDLAKLDALAERGNRGFTFVHGVAVEVIQDTTAASRNADGQCTQLLKETVNLDFGDGVLLTSEEWQLQNATGCP